MLSPIAGNVPLLTRAGPAIGRLVHIAEALSYIRYLCRHKDNADTANAQLQHRNDNIRCVSARRMFMRNN